MRATSTSSTDRLLNGNTGNTNEKDDWSRYNTWYNKGPQVTWRCSSSNIYNMEENSSQKMLKENIYRIRAAEVNDILT